ncbi:MAG: CDP-archaeol synthase [Candidatus Omnitrophica bacterium]|nr:CDP-archaeol synthase [Candidatus Omnitrophota bacterium]
MLSGPISGRKNFSGPSIPSLPGKGDSVGSFEKRTLVSAVLILFVLAAIFLFPAWAFCLIISVFTASGLMEFFGMAEKKGLFVYRGLGAFGGCLLPVVVFAGNLIPGANGLEPILIAVLGFSAMLLQFRRKGEKRDHLTSMALILFGLFYIAWFFSFFVKLRLLPGGPGLIAFVVFVTKGADIGAYLAGSRFGHTKLIPRISPGKTLEGTAGGVLMSVIIALFAGKYLTSLGAFELIASGLVLSVLGQLGDLVESLIKRDCGVKDSGRAFPGIGGVMDLIDSLLFTGPVFYFYITMVR